MQSGLDVHYDFGDGHPLLGRRIPDIDLDTNDRPLRLFSLLHQGRPVLLSFVAFRDKSPVINIKRWASCVQLIEATHEGDWVLPTLGRVDAPKAALIRPDGYVAWVGDERHAGLAEALSTWFGPDAE